MSIAHHSVRLCFVLLLLLSPTAYADFWNCSYDNLVREVVVDYPQGGALPCAVIYKKQTEGFADQELWNAENLEGYCEDKARELVSKLESLGWVCLETIGSQGGESM